LLTDAVTTRILSPADEGHVRSAFTRLSADSRHLRYGMPLVHPGSLLDWVALLGRGTHLALGAWAGEGNLVGVARCVRQGDSAEVAVTIVDDWQERGVGTLLLDALLCEARAHGLATLTASVIRENKRGVRLARRFGGRSAGYVPGGRIDFEIPTLRCPSPGVRLPSVC
jgi:GNAT superfamily N-acetyltransferase